MRAASSSEEDISSDGPVDAGEAPEPAQPEAAADLPSFQALGVNQFVQASRAPRSKGHGFVDFMAHAPPVLLPLRRSNPFLIHSQEALARAGIAEPSPIQAAVFGRIGSGKSDIAIKSYTGSGKTYAYLLPILSRIMDEVAAAVRPTDSRGYEDAADRLRYQGPAALVIVPTADLAMQIVRSIRAVVPGELQRIALPVIGGANMRRQIVSIHGCSLSLGPFCLLESPAGPVGPLQETLQRSRPMILVGTPGRVADLSRQALVRLHEIPLLVLDEADQLLGSTYLEDMKRIVEHVRTGPGPSRRSQFERFHPSRVQTGRKVPGGRQSVLVSATVTPASLHQARSYEYCRPDVEIVSVTPLKAKPAPGAGAEGKDGQWGWDDAEDAWNKDMGVMTEGAAGGVRTDDVVQEMPPNLIHLAVKTNVEHRVDRLRRCLHAIQASHCLVFMNFQRRLRDTEAKLGAKSGMEVETLHGEMSPQERKAAIERFRLGKLRAMVVSDVAARGMDFPNCDVVFNLELPSRWACAACWETAPLPVRHPERTNAPFALQCLPLRAPGWAGRPGRQGGRRDHPVQQGPGVCDQAVGAGAADNLLPGPAAQGRDGAGRGVHRSPEGQAGPEGQVPGQGGEARWVTSLSLLRLGWIAAPAGL